MEPPSSPPSGSTRPEDALAWYKAQYEQLESELAEFKESSMELERELERDIEDAEKRERTLQDRAEGLTFEVEEWKRKYKEAKVESNAAQNNLEKEITTLRDTNRTLQLRLRDIEVANDDFERQARNTTSSLEDMESKHNMAVERAVLLEEEMRIGEQERETLRIDTQRLKEELADLKIEAELLQDKVKKYESRHLSTISTDISVLESPTFDKNITSSPGSTASSPLLTTPTDLKSLTGECPPEPLEPPSPPMSEASASMPKFKTPIPPYKARVPSIDQQTAPKVRGRPPTLVTRPAANRSATASSSMLRTSTGPLNRTTPRAISQRVPVSNSLSHIRNLTAQMQRLEDRVHRARSKLPNMFIQTPPGVSPRESFSSSTGPAMTIRSRKRGQSSVSSSVFGDEPTPTGSVNRHIPRLSTSGVSRLSFGPLPNRGPNSTSAESDFSVSRPSSRASMTSSSARPESRTGMVRPASRTSFSSVRTPMRPRSSLGGSVHSHSASVDEGDEEDESDFRTPSRRGTYSKYDHEPVSISNIPISNIPISSIPMPSRRLSSGIARRTSSVSMAGLGVSGSMIGRPASSMGFRTPRPPSVAGGRPLDDLGETY